MAVDRVVANVDLAIRVPSMEILIARVQNLSEFLVPKDIISLLCEKLGLV
jgi:hypothetical protein